MMAAQLGKNAVGPRREHAAFFFWGGGGGWSGFAWANGVRRVWGTAATSHGQSGAFTCLPEGTNPL